MLIRNLIFLSIFFLLNSMNLMCEHSILIEAAEKSDFDKIRKILNSSIAKKISRREYDIAILTAAENGDVEIFSLLEARVGRWAHRKSYKLLTKKVPRLHQNNY